LKSGLAHARRPSAKRRSGIGAPGTYLHSALGRLKSGALCTFSGEPLMPVAGATMPPPAGRGADGDGRNSVNGQKRALVDKLAKQIPTYQYDTLRLDRTTKGVGFALLAIRPGTDSRTKADDRVAA
jgi:hypothetical protein